MLNLPAAALFAFVASITPGPNNVMLWASGMNYGLRRTIPHLAGVNLGFTALLMATAVGLGALFQTAPWLSLLLRLVGSAYLVYLAYRIATAAGTSGVTRPRPFTFLEAAAFQFVNPKAWVMGITAVGSFLPPTEPLLTSTILLAVVFATVNLPCITTWAAAGTALGTVFSDERKRRVINWILALLLVFSVYLINI